MIVIDCATYGDRTGSRWIGGSMVTMFCFFGGLIVSVLAHHTGFSKRREERSIRPLVSGPATDKSK
jgi:hypothetical protein